MSRSGSFWFDVLCFLGWLYIVFHFTSVIAFLDRLIAS